MEREGGKGKERKGKGTSGLSPKNSCGHQCFNLLVLNWFIDGKLIIKTDTSFQISLRLY